MRPVLPMNRLSPARRLLHRLRHSGANWLWGALRDRLVPVRPVFWELARTAILDRRGLEIGGPSRIFRRRGALPAYEWATSVDNVNFATETAWEHGLGDGGPFPFHPRKPPGSQWLREAANLAGIADGCYDVALSSHCLEHLANPLAALDEWRRVTKPNGCLLVIVPDSIRTFDHHRPVTTLQHLRDDRARRVMEDDRTHFHEVLALHDLALDPDAGDAEAFRTRVEQNAQHRCVHHHIFDERLLEAALREAGWQPVAVERFLPVHLGALAQKEGT